MESHGWRLFAHSLFLAQIEELTRRVEKLVSADPSGYDAHPAAKLLATINHYVVDAIPRNPNAPEFRQRNTLGPHNRHWFRARFHARYRLFYRFSSEHKVIVYVWVNDEDSLRKSGFRTDPYAVFRLMLTSGEPPNAFADLMRAAKEIPVRAVPRKPKKKSR